MLILKRLHKDSVKLLKQLSKVFDKINLSNFIGKKFHARARDIYKF